MSDVSCTVHAATQFLTIFRDTVGLHTLAQLEILKAAVKLACENASQNEIMNAIRKAYIDVFSTRV